MTKLFLFVFFLILSIYTNDFVNKPPIEIDKQSDALNINHNFTKILSMGQNRMISDLLWITTLLESDLDHYKKTDLNSWLYLRFKTIAELDPLFLGNYRFGGLYLSIVKDDLMGAADIYTRGLSIYPNDINLNQNAAFLYTFELKDYDQALKLYTKMKDLPGSPRFVTSIIYKLQQKAGFSPQEIFDSMYSTYITLEEDSMLKNKLRNDLYSLRVEIDLQCLNEGGNNCNKTDFFNLPYIYEEGKYKSQRQYKKYQLYDK